MTANRACVALLAILIALVAAVRIHLAAIPLERDEGEYAYAGQLMLEGVPPYRLAWNMKLPGTYAAHALIMAVFGQTVRGIHYGLLVVNVLTILLVFLLGWQIFGPLGGLAAAATYAVLSVSPGVLGTASHATHYVVLPAVAATLLLLRFLSRPFWPGLLYGTAFLMKQHGAAFILFGACYLLWSGLRGGGRRRTLQALLVYSAGAALPFGVTCALLWRAGVFPNFWYWTFTYARTYTTIVPIGLGVQLLAHNFAQVLSSAPALWICAAGGLALAWRKRKERATALLLTAFLVFSFLGAAPGLYFRRHYFILTLPAAALFVGLAVVARPRVILPLVAGSLVLSVHQQREFFFHMGPDDAARRLWGGGIFVKAKLVGEWLRTHSARETRVAVLGSEPEIYFYAGRRSATGYLYMYPVMEPKPDALRMQNDLIRQIEAVSPQFVVFAYLNPSWDRTDSSPIRVFQWWPPYRDANYSLAAWVFVREPDAYFAIYKRKL